MENVRRRRRRRRDDGDDDDATMTTMFVQTFFKFSLLRRDRFGPKIVKIRAILAVFRPFEVFAIVSFIIIVFHQVMISKLVIYSVSFLQRPAIA